MTFTLDDLNRMDQPAFTQALGWIFEHSPWVAERAWGARPFATCEALHQAMVAQVQTAAAAEQIALLRAHPDLGTRAEVSPVSTQEQAGAGLDRLSPAEYDLFTGMNQGYAAKFGFPFIMAVRGQTRAALLAALRNRLEREQAAELAQALQEVYKIAWFRLADTVLIPDFSYGKGDVIVYRTQGAQATGSWSLARTAGGVAVVDHAGGVQGLQLLNMSGNSFAGFIQDEYTTMPDACDHSLFLFLDIAWVYTTASDALGEAPERYVPAEQIRDLVLVVFDELQAGSIQHLLYHVGHRILERFPQLAEVSFTGQNRPWETVVEAGGARVLTEPRPPYGIQLYRVRRYGAGE